MTNTEIACTVATWIAWFGLGVWMARVSSQLSELKCKSLDAAEILEKNFDFGEPRVIALLNGTLTIGCVVGPQCSTAAAPKETFNRRQSCGRSAEAPL